MNLLQGITDQPKQRMSIPLADGSAAVMALYWTPNQLGWFFDISWGATIINGQRIIASPNVLRQYLNTLPFGLAVVTSDQSDPSTQTAFIDASTQVYLLQGDDLTRIEEIVYGGPAVPVPPTSAASTGVPTAVLPISWGPAGGDLRGTYPSPDVVAFHESATNQRLTIGAVAPGEYLKRVGNVLLGDIPSGAGIGTVTQVNTGTGLTGGPITGIGTVSLATTAVTPAAYTNANITVDAQGRITAAANGSVGGSTVSFSSIAAMRGASPGSLINGGFYMLESYNGYSDGGGGEFTWISVDNYSYDDGGTLIVPGGTIGTPATVGCFHRTEVGTRGNTEFAPTLDVRWFGAIPGLSGGSGDDCMPGIVAAYNSLMTRPAPGSGTLYFPAGIYHCWTKGTFTGGTAITFKGDGPHSSVLMYRFTSANTAMLDVGGWSKASFFDLSIEAGPSPTFSTNVLHLHGIAVVNLRNVAGINMGGTFIRSESTGVESDINLNAVGVSTFGGSGTQLYARRTGGLVSNCSFKTAYSTPCLWIASCNSLEISNSFFEGGGPYKSLTGCAITSTSSDFTITKSGHGFLDGDWINISDAANIGYNEKWRIASVTSTTITVLSSANFGSDTAVVSSLFSCGLIGGSNSGDNATESSISNCLFNTGGLSGPTGTAVVSGGAVVSASVTYAGVLNYSGTASVTFTPISPAGGSGATGTAVMSRGRVASITITSGGSGYTNGAVAVSFSGGDARPPCSIGLWLSGQTNNGIGGWKIHQCTFDYGSTGLFLHGRTNTDPGSNVGSIIVSDCGPNGGPRNNFGAFRLEGVVNVTLANLFCFPGGAEVLTSYTGELSSVVISDGGQGNYTQDIRLNGGIYTNRQSSALYPLASLYAVTYDGANVRNVSALNIGVDTTNSWSRPTRYLNGASTANHILTTYNGDESGDSLLVTEGNAFSRNTAGSIYNYIGQSRTRNLVSGWQYDATPANASALISTYGQANDINFLAKALNFSPSGLAFALQILQSGRCVFGGGADDGLHALQTSSLGLSGPARLANYVVSGLPSASSSGAGAMVYVTDSTVGIAAGIGATVVGGGSDKVPVVSDGANWRIF